MENSRGFLLENLMTYGFAVAIVALVILSLVLLRRIPTQ